MELSRRENRIKLPLGFQGGDRSFRVQRWFQTILTLEVDYLVTFEFVWRCWCGRCTPQGVHRCLYTACLAKLIQRMEFMCWCVKQSKQTDFQRGLSTYRTGCSIEFFAILHCQIAIVFLLAQRVHFFAWCSSETNGWDRNGIVSLRIYFQ